MQKRLSPAAIISLKEALSSIYWYKSDLKGFLRQCLSQPDVLTKLEWSNNYKRQIVSDLVDLLLDDQDVYLGDLTRLCNEVCRFTTFKHLEQLDDGLKKAKKAEEAVEHLRTLFKTHSKSKKENEQTVKRRQKSRETTNQSRAITAQLDNIKKRYMELAISKNAQGRGFDLEKIMYDLFELFDLDPKASFRVQGEQIDGAFTLSGTDYLFEAKWQKEQVGASHLDSFSGKVRRKLDNTLGVFLSINGFSDDGVSAHESGRAAIFLLDGADLMAVLDERIDFTNLLKRKKQHAARTGKIYLRINELGI